MAIAYITHPDCLLHDMGDAHPEQPARLQFIEDALKKAQLFDFMEHYQAPLATQEELLRVHDAHYMEQIFKLAPTKGLLTLDPDTLMNPYSLNAALRAAGAVIHGVDLVLSRKVNAAFCNVRPPGHHAEHDRAMGFCIFNNIAVGVAHALQQHQLKRIAIVDFDVHHGNGTENIFLNDQRVLFCSSFQHPFYPFSGADTQSSHIINLPIPAGSAGEAFRESTKNYWFEVLEQFKPELIFFSAGFDGHAEDAMSNLYLHEHDYEWLTGEVKMIADRVCEGRIVSVLEGGYALEALGRSVAAHVRALL